MLYLSFRVERPDYYPHVLEISTDARMSCRHDDNGKNLEEETWLEKEYRKGGKDIAADLDMRSIDSIVDVW